MLLHCVLAIVFVSQGCLAQSVRISNGQEAPPHQFPYQVSIAWNTPPLFGYIHVCGGAILNKDWILTAGHCVTRLPLFGVIGVQAGKHIVDQQEDGQQFSGVELKIVHWKYTGGTGQHDIALLKLKTPLEFNKIVAPISLPMAGKVHTGQSVISGWGSYSKNDFLNTPNVLQTATLPILDNEQCLEALQEFNDDAVLFDTEFCTGTPRTIISTCFGDSGGPLVQYDDEVVPELVGIISWRKHPCGSGAPSVYTRVSSYVDWINDKLYD